ncbi:putative aspartic-type endopeptidase [Lachnellula hyalina]|uniref:Putative aspartic-type endopeptidase n=1 Tax=Lachnellula hyalina TaxID=1316788 RepID=A0A8H8U555_9HELO|nr:putative aspartic-type endopeptidase [Lachnellula hyalina]TVY30884.1 putative aspartic-type endopeptidase [Lachnellula hyalina]
MRTSTSISCALAALGSANALRLEKRDSPAVVSFPLEKVDKITSISPISDSKRDTGPIEDPIFQDLRQLVYMVQLEIGTPSQSISAVFDTGSPNLVIHTTKDKSCVEPAPNPCSLYGGYDANASSTYHYEDSNFAIEYQDGESTLGDDATDNVILGSKILRDFYIGLQYQTEILDNVLGASFTEDEMANSHSGHTNLPQLLRDQGHIASRAYSLYTDDSNNGSVLFGGVDIDRFHGDLVKIDLLSNPDTRPTRVTSFSIPLLSVSQFDGNSTTDFARSFPTRVTFDSGTSLTYLDPVQVQSIWTSVGAVAHFGNLNYATIPCIAAETDRTLDFEFAEVTIKVPLSQYVLWHDSHNDICVFGIAKGEPEGPFTIGVTTLSSIYVVYDLDNKQLHLAQAVRNAATSNILEIKGGPDGVSAVAG